MRTIVALVVALILSSCGGKDEDPADPVPLELAIVRFAGGSLVAMQPGETLPLVEAPQGGYFVFVGARVRGLTHGDVDMTARAVDVETGKAIGSSNTAHPLMTEGADGWFDPQHEAFNTLSMLQICPRGIGLDVAGREVTLTLDVKEIATGRTGQAHLSFRPTCQDAGCTCECAADFRPGACG
jgi:hypothetical protein